MKNRYLLIFVLVILSFSGNTQTTGYLGKRVLFNLDGTILSAKSYLLFPNRVIGFNGESDFFSFNFIFSPNFEFVVGDKWSVGATFHTCKTYFDGNNSREVIYDISDVSLPFIGLHVNGVGVFLKKYLFNQSHAPYGAYMKLQLDWLNLSFDAFQYGKYSTSAYGFKAEFGYDYLFFDKLRVSWGFTVGTTDDFINIFNTQRGTLIDLANQKVRGLYSISNKISIGFLAF